MNLKDDVIRWPERYKKIPPPLYVVRCDDHFMVCELDKDLNLITEKSNIHWDPYQVRRWALKMSEALQR